MSAAVAERPPSRWWVLSDYFEMVMRSLRHIANDPDQLVTVTLQPVLTLTIMDFFIGGAIKTGTRQDYLDFVLPGIFIVMAGFAAVTTALGVASDMLQGVVDRFRTLPMAKSAVVAGHVISDLPRALIGLAATIGFGLLIGFRSHGRSRRLGSRHRHDAARDLRPVLDRRCHRAARQERRGRPAARRRHHHPGLPQQSARPHRHHARLAAGRRR